MNQSAYIVMALIVLVLVVAALLPARQKETDPPYATFHDSTEPLLLPCDGWLEEASEHGQDEDGGDGTDSASCLTCGTPRTQCLLDQP
ncbi:hypothetical protein PV516_01075 [Streptomyces scabiei]|uniref:hypothetical protein n=1 Tax=Streptomyces scabiei TaxID=1930 RepID=UPI0029B159EF|nr:hypothetical protein [Streptomyces scabiei]MDX3162392.1 hypothetical protein [Streptomyces scabiei]